MANVIIGSLGNDFLPGTNKPDIIIGLSGNDNLLGKGSSDKLFGDYLTSGPLQAKKIIPSSLDNLSITLTNVFGNDWIYGDKGNDKLYGDAEKLNITFSTSDHKIKIKFGNDDLNGGKGNDTLYGDATETSVDIDTAGYNKTKIIFGNDQLNAGKGSGNIYGDVKNTDIFIDCGAHNKSVFKFGKDHISVKKMTLNPYKNNDTLFINGDAKMADTDILGGQSNNIKYNFANDKITINHLCLNKHTQTSLTGDADNISTDIASIYTAHLGVNNTVTYHLGNDTLHINTLIVKKAAEALLSGDALTANTIIQEGDSNYINYYTGNDDIIIDKIKGFALIAGDVLGDASTHIMGNSNTVNYHMGDDWITVGKSLGEYSTHHKLILTGDAKLAHTKIIGGKHDTIHYKTGYDVIKVKHICLEKHTEALVTGDALNISTHIESAYTYHPCSHNKVKYDLGDDTLHINKLIVEMGAKALISGDALQANSLIYDSDANQATYDMGYDDIVIDVAEGFVIVAGDALGDAGTKITGNDNIVNYHMGNDWITIGETLGDQATVVFGDAGNFDDTTLKTQVIDGDADANPSNTVNYTDGDDIIVAGDGGQTIYSDTIYEIIDIEDDPMITITRGNDTITLGDDNDADTVVFQILELTDSNGEYIGPGQDLVNNFTVSNDVLRFIIFDMTGDPSADLINLITDITVDPNDALISFADGSSIELTGNFIAEGWNGNVAGFVNTGVADGYIEVFDVTDVIPLT